MSWQYAHLHGHGWMDSRRVSLRERLREEKKVEVDRMAINFDREDNESCAESLSDMMEHMKSLRKDVVAGGKD
ncbi:hypothetical protein VNO80_04301 [Phaseolus coccineus]|uniref:Uncharacterized protein n=1 Tax=Phaseolus coccineus TaxID=3886 RepID=A0AAN9NXM8_PHACN